MIFRRGNPSGCTFGWRNFLGRVNLLGKGKPYPYELWARVNRTHTNYFLVLIFRVIHHPVCSKFISEVTMPVAPKLFFKRMVYFATNR